METDAQLMYYAKRGVLAEIGEWLEKKRAVAAMTGVLSEAELKRMLAGIDLEIESLRKYLDELNGRM